MYGATDLEVARVQAFGQLDDGEMSGAQLVEDGLLGVADVATHWLLKTSSSSPCGFSHGTTARHNE
jgi:hypothetical protein